MRDNQTELQTVPVDAEPLRPQLDINPPPDGGYGWVQVGVAFLINCFTWGQTAVKSPTFNTFHLACQPTDRQQSYSIHLAHYLSSNQFPTATPIDYALIGSLQFAVSLLIAPLVTTLARHFSTQPPLPILFAEVIALKLRRSGASNEYLYPQIFAGLSMILASLCLFELRRHKHSEDFFHGAIILQRRTAQV
ncbi:hypothetical protein BDZ45DRAFT_679609 [Acephala macrosclerotiorum]|nr:hypothetical protein BDZ45DRAFT_679609 [Acephala macrosclerotiorum]